MKASPALHIQTKLSSGALIVASSSGSHGGGSSHFSSGHVSAAHAATHAVHETHEAARSTASVRPLHSMEEENKGINPMDHTKFSKPLEQDQEAHDAAKKAPGILHKKAVFTRASDSKETLYRGSHLRLVHSETPSHPATPGTLVLGKAGKTQGQIVHHVFPPFDTQYFASHIFWLILSFGFFYFFLSRFVLPALGSTIETRKDRIVSDLDRAAALKQQSDDLVAQYEKELSQAREKSRLVAQDAAKTIKMQIEQERKNMEEDLEKKLKEAEAQLAVFQEESAKKLHSISQPLVSDMLEKLLGRTFSKEEILGAIKAGKQ